MTLTFCTVKLRRSLRIQAGRRVNLEPVRTYRPAHATFVCEDARDGGVHLVPAYEPTDLTTMRRGEIPSCSVVHTMGSAWTVRGATWKVSMSSTPYTVWRTLVSSHVQSPVTTETHATTPATGSSQPHNITMTKEICGQIVRSTKHDDVGVFFTKNATSHTAADQKRLVKAAIIDAAPQFCSSTVSFNSIVNKNNFVLYPKRLRTHAETLSTWHAAAYLTHMGYTAQDDIWDGH